MFAIYKKELRSYLNSFIGLLFIGVTLFFLGLYYTVYNLLYGYPYYSYVISSTSFLFMIAIPILTMRILSEERHNKTDQLILTVNIVGKMEEMIAKDTIVGVTDMEQYGLAEPTRTFSFETATERYEFYVGDYNDFTGMYYICKPGENTVYTVNAATVTCMNLDVMEIVEEEESTETEVTEYEAEATESVTETAQSEVGSTEAATD